MDSQQQYDTVVNLAVSMAKVTTRERLKTTETWKPFTLLYAELIKRKEIEPLKFQTEEIIRNYWNETKSGDERHKRIFIMQALYCYDLIMKE